MEARRKLLIQMSGAPGSGKSTLANLLARHSLINGVVINHDLIKSFFLEKGNNFQSSAILAYDFQWSLARDLLNQGHNVIIDSTCNFTETLDQGTALARQYNYQYTYIECRMSVSDIDLLEKRLPDSNGANLTNHDPLARFETWIESPVRPCPASNVVIAVDSTRSPADCLNVALQQMGLSS